MTIKEVVETASVVLVSLGGGGVIVVGCSTFIGKVWADRSLERYKQGFAQINIAFQSQLDIATRRVQVELDALSLVHNLRTREEFTRLAELWKRMADLRNSFLAVAPQGFNIGYADPEHRKEWEAKARQQFDLFVNEAQKYLALEALFIPKHICDAAQKAVVNASQEQINFSTFEPYRGMTLPMDRQAADPIVELRRNYEQNKSEAFRNFTQNVEELERLMREHIAGKSSARLDTLDSANSTNV